MNKTIEIKQEQLSMNIYEILDFFGFEKDYVRGLRKKERIKIDGKAVKECPSTDFYDIKVYGNEVIEIDNVIKIDLSKSIRSEKEFGRGTDKEKYIVWKGVVTDWQEEVVFNIIRYNIG